MHPGDGLLDGLVHVLQVALARLAARKSLHRVRWRVSHTLVVQHALLMFRDALLAEGLVVAHAEHVDRLVMFRANRILLDRGHLRSHLIRYHLRTTVSGQIRSHIYKVIALLQLNDRRL